MKIAISISTLDIRAAGTFHLNDNVSKSISKNGRHFLGAYGKLSSPLYATYQVNIVNNFSMQIAISISTCRPCSNSTICAAGAACTTGAHDATPVQDIVPGHPSCFIQLWQVNNICYATDRPVYNVSWTLKLQFSSRLKR